MSTILKALKKLEQETQSAQAAAALTTIDAESEDGSPKKGSKRIWMGLCIATGLGLGLGLFLLLRPTAPPTATPPQGRLVPAPPAAETKASGSELPLPQVFPPPKPGDEKRASTDPARAQSASSARHETLVEPLKEAQNTHPSEPAIGKTGSATTAAQTTRPTSPPPPIATQKAEPPPRPAPQSPAPQDRKGPPASEGSPTAPGAATATAAATATEPTTAPTTQAAPQPTSQAAPPAAPQPLSPSPPALDEASTPEEGPSSAVKGTAPKEPAAPAAPPAAEKPAAAPRSEEDPFANVSRLEANSPIKLQAISWAQDANKSITVINNTVLHEGDSVEGYTVVKIRPDDVILRRSGRMWRATF